MKILVFGKHGQIARALHEEANSTHEIIALGREEADLFEKGIVVKEITRHAPDIIVNAAAYTAVDNAENETEAANHLNTVVPGEMASAAHKTGSHFVHISSDYVFDGDSASPYREDDPTKPLNVYGASKLAGEDAVMVANKGAIIVRTSWVFSEFGANFVKTMLRLAGERDTLSVVDDQIGGPTSARDIAIALLTIAQKKYRGAAGEGVYHFQGAPVVTWAGFAKKIFEIAGAQTLVTPIPTSQFPTPAARPLHTVLDCARLERDFGIPQPDWRPALRQVIEALQKKDEQP